MTREYAVASLLTIRAQPPEDDPVLGDGGEYPSDVELTRIATWPMPNFGEITKLLAYMRLRWRWPNYWTQRGRFHHVSTGGWSGHEDMIGALQDDPLTWQLIFVSERRGGHYIFEDRSLRVNA